MSKNSRKKNNMPQSVNSMPPALQEVIKGLPEEKRKEIISSLYIRSSHFQGPIPPPEMFREYEMIQSGSADRILKMSEKQQDHRIKSESRVIIGEIVLKFLGMICGASIVLFLIYFAYKLAINDHDNLALSMIGIAVAVAIVFVLRKAPNDKNK